MNQPAEAESTDAVPTAVDTANVEGTVPEVTCALNAPRVNKSLTSRPEPSMLSLATVIVLSSASEIADPSAICSFRLPPAGTSSVSPLCTVSPRFNTRSRSIHDPLTPMTCPQALRPLHRPRASGQISRAARQPTCGPSFSNLGSLSRELSGKEYGPAYDAIGRQIIKLY